jgi:hypothetical protein
MRTFIGAIGAAALLASPATAAETKLSGAEITALLADHVMAGEADGKPWQQIFQKGGMTLYQVGGAQSQGFWQVRGDQYCSQWPPGETWSCYDMTRDAETYFFVSSSGQRSPAKLLK